MDFEHFSSFRRILCACAQWAPSSEDSHLPTLDANLGPATLVLRTSQPIRRRHHGGAGGVAKLQWTPPRPIAMMTPLLA
jgi:hypothetical protein